MIRLIYLFVFSLLIFSIISCKKEKVVAEENHTNVILNSDSTLLGGNNPPPDSTIALIIKENYINRLYVSLLGREPIQIELNSGLIILNQANVSIASRKQLIQTIITDPNYNYRLYDIAAKELIGSVDTNEIMQEIALLQFLLTDSTYLPFFPQINYEIGRLTLLKNAPIELEAGVIKLIEVHKRLVNNSFYDEINMGTENFVVSSFQHFFNRYPSSNELQEATSIVDGLGGILFFKQGASKADYLQIIFSSNEYFEGQIYDLFQRYLFRPPTSVESSMLSEEYKASLNYLELQEAILTSNEYVGL